MTVLKIRHPEDVAQLRREVPALKDRTDYEVQALYSDYSEDFWAAGWMHVHESTVEEFKGWLAREVARGE